MLKKPEKPNLIQFKDNDFFNILHSEVKSFYFGFSHEKHILLLKSITKAL